MEKIFRGMHYNTETAKKIYSSGDEILLKKRNGDYFLFNKKDKKIVILTEKDAKKWIVTKGNHEIYNEEFIFPLEDTTKISKGISISKSSDFKLKKLAKKYGKNESEVIEELIDLKFNRN